MLSHQRRAHTEPSVAEPQAAYEPDALQPAGNAFALATMGGASSLPRRSIFEAAFGEDFSDVQVHTGQDAAMTRLGANAAASGNVLTFAEASPDDETIAHELAHVVQQRNAGRSGPASGSPTTSRPGDADEVEAERAARQVTAGQAVDVTGRASADLHGDWLDDLADNALDAAGARPDEAVRDAMEDIHRQLADMGGGIATVEAFCSSGLRGWEIQAEALQLVQQAKGANQQLMSAVRGVRSGDGLALDAIVAGVERGAGTLVDGADDPRNCLLLLEVACREVGGALGPVAPGPAGAMASLGNGFRLSTLQKEVEANFVEGVTLEEIEAARDQILAKASNAKTGLETILIWLEPVEETAEAPPVAKSIRGIATHLDTLGKIAGRFKKAENLGHLLIALDGLGGVDPKANPEAAAHAFDQLFEAMGAVGEDWLPEPLGGYAAFVREAGRSGFFSRMSELLGDKRIRDGLRENGAGHLGVARGVK